MYRIPDDVTEVDTSGEWAWWEQYNLGRRNDTLAQIVANVRDELATYKEE